MKAYTYTKPREVMVRGKRCIELDGGAIAAMAAMGRKV